MKLARLKPFEEPPARPKRACAACGAFAPECLVPIGDTAAPMCWLCAHHIVEHGLSVVTAINAVCACPPGAIYPTRAGIQAQAAPEQEPVRSDRVTEREALLKSADKLREWAREAHKQMSAAQHEAVRRRLKS